MTSNRASNDVELTIKGDLQALRLQPGDLLVCSLKSGSTYAEADGIVKRLQIILDRAGLNNQVIVLSEGVQLAASRE